MDITFDCEGTALTRYYIDDIVHKLPRTEVKIVCDNWAFMKIKDMYDGWLSMPKIVCGKAVMEGVFPFILQRFLVCSSELPGELKFLDDDDNVIAEIINYSTSC